MEKNIDLAAALLYAQGMAIPHKRELEDEAFQLAGELEGRIPILQRVLDLCGEPRTPRELYISEKASAWMGRGQSARTAELAEQYLNGEAWSELPSHTAVEEGVAVNQAASSRAGVVLDLAAALQALGRTEEALSRYLEAYRLEPGNAQTAVKAAGIMALRNGKEEALRYLRAQRSSVFFKPAKYTDSSGRVRYNDTFKQLLNAYILKMENA